MEIQKQGIGSRIWRIFSIPASCKENKNMAVALYARVSTTKQAEKDRSIPDQLKQMREWCKAQGLVVAAEYVELGAQSASS
jgi:predicted site-specific integrase-resolvase